MVVAIFFKRLFLCDGDGAGGDGLKTITALVSWSLPQRGLGDGLKTIKTLVSWSLPLRGLGGATFGWEQHALMQLHPDRTADSVQFSAETGCYEPSNHEYRAFR
jgi:hypothetical protein